MIFCQKDQVKSLFEEHGLYRRNSAKLGLDLVPAQLPSLCRRLSLPLQRGHRALNGALPWCLAWPVSTQHDHLVLIVGCEQVQPVSLDLVPAARKVSASAIFVFFTTQIWLVCTLTGIQRSFRHLRGSVSPVCSLHDSCGHCLQACGSRAQSCGFVVC